jgi:hypothetical protein
MSNWFKKMFGGKDCCKKPEETAQPMSSTPMNMESAPEVKPEMSQPENVEKTQ